jgi:hypothetical protein
MASIEQAQGPPARIPGGRSQTEAPTAGPAQAARAAASENAVIPRG